MNILITGAAGFIGFAIADRLSHSHDVVGIDNFNDYYNPSLKRDRAKQLSKTILYEKDIAVPQNLVNVFDKHRFDCIIHLAAQAGVRYSIDNPWAYERANLLGTLNVLEFAAKHKVPKVIYASSSSVYGGNTKLPFTETDNVDSPISIYAATKKANELMAHVYHNMYGLKTIGLRFFTVYGPWGRPDMAAYKWAELMSQGRPINVYNHGKMQRDFTYIDDIVDGIESCVGADLNHEVFNLGNDRTVELEYYIELLEGCLGIKAKRNYMDMQPGDVKKTWADITKARKLLNYNPTTSIEKGLGRFVEWYKEYKK